MAVPTAPAAAAVIAPAPAPARAAEAPVAYANNPAARVYYEAPYGDIWVVKSKHNHIVTSRDTEFFRSFAAAVESCKLRSSSCDPCVIYTVNGLALSSTDEVCALGGCPCGSTNVAAHDAYARGVKERARLAKEAMAAFDHGVQCAQDILRKKLTQC